MRDTSGTGSDYITVVSATDGTLTITPTASDYTELSDNFGVFVGEFRVTDSNDDIICLKDVRIRIDEVLA